MLGGCFPLYIREEVQRSSYTQPLGDYQSCEPVNGLCSTRSYCRSWDQGTSRSILFRNEFWSPTFPALLFRPCLAFRFHIACLTAGTRNFLLFSLHDLSSLSQRICRDSELRKALYTAKEGSVHSFLGLLSGNVVFLSSFFATDRVEGIAHTLHLISMRS